MIPSDLLRQVQNRMRFLPFLMFFKREVHRFSKVFFQTVFIPVVNSSLYLIIFGVSLGSQISFGDISYLEFIIPGLVMMSCLNNAFQNGSSSILSLKFAGDIIDIKVSPLTSGQLLWALAFGGVCRGFLVGLIVFGVGEIFSFFYLNHFLVPVSLFYLFIFCLIACLVFSKVGVAIALWARTFDHIGAIGGLVILPLTYLGGVFFSIDILSPFWKKLSLMNPILYFINGIRYSLLGVSDVSVTTCLIVSLSSLVIFHGICLYAIRNSSYQRW